MNTVLEVLRAGRSRIERGWTQGDFAFAGAPVPEKACNADDPTATCWCALGALGWGYYAMVGDSAPTAAQAEAAGLLERLIDGMDVAEWNDAPGRTQAEVLALYDQAIATVEAEVQP